VLNRAVALLTEEGKLWLRFTTPSQDGDRSLRFRARSLLRAAEALQKFRPKDLVAASQLAGIGTGILDRLERIVEGKVPQSLLDARQRGDLTSDDWWEHVHGLGPVRIAALRAEGISTLAQLRSWADTNAHELPASARISLTHWEDLQEPIPRAESDRFFTALRAALPKRWRPELVGSYRRQRPTSSDWDLLVVQDGVQTPAEVVSRLPYPHETLSDGSHKWEGLVQGPAGKWRRLDLRMARPEAYGAMLLYFTGSKEHNVWMRQKAHQKGYRLNEYGLWDKKGALVAGGPNELPFFQALQLPYVAPHLREAGAPHIHPSSTRRRRSSKRAPRKSFRSRHRTPRPRSRTRKS
jgi:DNA polymerase (family 10)